MHEQRDLFNDIPVTLEDVQIWIDVVPGWPRTSSRRDYYARHWDVADKIKAAKISGFWLEVLRLRSEQVRSVLG